MAAAGSQASGDNLLGEAVTSLMEGNKVFDRYTLMKAIGHSRTSVVWKAWDERLGRDVVLKFLPAVSKPDASALATLKSHVKKLQEIKHPQIVSLDNVENEGPLVAIVTDYVEGHSLGQYREQKSDLVFSPPELKDWMQQLCGVLDHGHNEGMTPHGALKPSNLLIDQRGVLRVTDFGLENAVNEFVARTTEIQDAGRELVYLSPQQANGEPVGPLDDIYAFGASVYELLTSKPPFYTGDLMLQLQQKVPPPMTHRRKELRVIGEPIPRVWEETVAACLAKDPAQRPQGIAQIVEMLELQSAAAEAPVELAPAPPPPSNKPIAIVAGVALLMIAVVAAVLLGKKKTDTVASNNTGTNQTGLSAEALKELEAKRKLADEQARKQREELQKRVDAAKAEEERLRKEAARLKLEEAQRLAAAKKAEEEAGERIRAANEEAKRIQAEAEKARQMAAAGGDAEAERRAREAEEKLKAAEATALRLIEDAKKKAAEEAARVTAASKASQEAAARQAAAMAVAQKADDERRRKEAELEKMRREQEMVLIAARKKAAEEEAARKVAEEAARKKAAEAAAAADLARRQYSPDKPVWHNSLGMKFAKVGSVHFAVIETRVSDFDAFVKATRHDAGRGWSSPGFRQGQSHPVVNVSWADAQAFCQWLTEADRKQNLIGNRVYRLPSDVEWSQAVGLQGESGATPLERDGRNKTTFPWGGAWPPAVGAGNYVDSFSYDRFENTAPVGSFRANAFGLHDLGGNVWEWCNDWSDSTQKTRVLRGGSWYMNLPTSLLSSYRRHLAPAERHNDVGFRVVLAEQ
jgi:serine/threonine protein kinase/formylglycine-generating enzyme required for sulfatase activity